MFPDNLDLTHPIETKVYYGITYSVGMTSNGGIRVKIAKVDGPVEADVPIIDSATKPIEELFKLGHQYAEKKIQAEAAS